MQRVSEIKTLLFKIQFLIIMTYKFDTANNGTKLNMNIACIKMLTKSFKFLYITSAFGNSGFEVVY